ncbi:condensation domain-containing protein [Kutzneria buriramensis]|uniref:condensation domain-containing protein n=1 Tax=Kutzneria buriramensis TaxID=1045776 RepID=UPI0035EA3023
MLYHLDWDCLALARQPTAETVPLPAAQRRVWFLNHLGLAGSDHAIPLSLRLTGRLDRAALEAALADVATRNATQRTVFPTEGARSAPVTRGWSPTSWGQVDEDKLRERKPHGPRGVRAHDGASTDHCRPG